MNKFINLRINTLTQHPAFIMVTSFNAIFSNHITVPEFKIQL